MVPHKAWWSYSKAVQRIPSDGSVHPVYYQFFPSLVQHWTQQLTHLLIPRVTMEVTTTHVAFTLYKTMSNWRIKGKTVMISYYVIWILLVFKITLRNLLRWSENQRLRLSLSVKQKLIPLTLIINPPFLAIPYTAMTGRRVEVVQHYIKNFVQSTSAAAYSSSSDLMTSVLVKAIILPCYTRKLLDITICTVPTYESI